jgi:alpha-ribazole phosphatase
MENLQITTIDLLRHGACEGGEIFRGSTDVPLTEQGWQQMRDTLAAHSGWQRIICSPLQRCRLFAETLAARETLPLEVDEQLRELHFGDWEGRRIVDIQREHGTSLRSFWSNPTEFTPPNGEPMIQFRERVLQAAAGIQQRHRGRHVLLIAHGAVIRQLLCEWLQMPMTAFSNIAVPYAGLSRVRIYYRDNAAPWLQLCLHQGE